MHPTKMDEPIKVLFGMQTQVGPEPRREGAIFVEAPPLQCDLSSTFFDHLLMLVMCDSTRWQG